MQGQTYKGSLQPFSIALQDLFLPLPKIPPALWIYFFLFLWPIELRPECRPAEQPGDQSRCNNLQSSLARVATLLGEVPNRSRSLCRCEAVKTIEMNCQMVLEQILFTLGPFVVPLERTAAMRWKSVVEANGPPSGANSGDVSDKDFVEELCKMLPREEFDFLQTSQVQNGRHNANITTGRNSGVPGDSSNCTALSLTDPDLDTFSEYSCETDASDTEIDSSSVPTDGKARSRGVAHPIKSELRQSHTGSAELIDTVYVIIFVPPEHHLLLRFTISTSTTVVRVATDRYELLGYIDSLFDSWKLRRKYRSAKS
eukprot:GHVS01063106.1.p1 GENE.GHVS01063106.1~~GHVS01063106.1.p1  ORF type:complete len:313 (+),score=12.51 GHVS01063106.1:357-1295(+)